MTQDDMDFGYSPASGAEPASTTIRTNSEGLETERTTIDTADGPMPVYAARPADDPHAPVILVISEAFGLNAHIADIARRFAHHGYHAIAPDLMQRQGNPLDFQNVDALVHDLLLHIPDRQVMSDLDATVAWAKSRGGDTDRLTATGYCWGGRWTWLYAAHRPLAAAVAWYGIIDGSSMFPNDAALFPRHPLEVTDELQTPLLGLYGGRDEAIAIETIEAMRAKLLIGSAAAKHSEIVVFPEAGHAFFADDRESYRREEAEEAWRRCLAWLDARVGG